MVPKHAHLSNKFKYNTNENEIKKLYAYYLAPASIS